MAKKKMIKPQKFTVKRQGPGFKTTMIIDLKRFEKQFQDAQYSLDNMVMTSMEPFMPKRMGNFITETKAMSAARAGSGKVVAAAPPYGRFLYYGKVMVDPKTGSPWARKDAEKVLTNQKLDFFKGENPDVQPEWFEVAKKRNGDNWIAQVKRTAGGGTRG